MGRVQHGSRTKGSAKSQLKSHKTKRYTRDLDQIALDLSLAHAVRSLPSSSHQTPAGLVEGEGAAAHVKQHFGGTASNTVTGDVDEDTPGMGKWPCVECSRFLADEESLKGHQRGKVHKRRVKELKRGAFTHAESLRAAGMSVDNRQRKTRSATGTATAASPVTEDMVEQLEAVQMS